MGSEHKEELQEERGLPQLETCLQHGPEHVCPPQVRTPSGQGRCQRVHKPPASSQFSPSVGESNGGVSLVSSGSSSLLTEQPERPGGLSPDDCHPEPRPGPQRSQQFLHPEVGQTTSGPLSTRCGVRLHGHVCVCVCRSDHPLAQLYCHSTMEHHHFDHCLMILNSPVGAPLRTLRGCRLIMSSDDVAAFDMCTTPACVIDNTSDCCGSLWTFSSSSTGVSVWDLNR